MRPGINKILPKQLVQELIDNQGRRQMEHWLKSNPNSNSSSPQQSRENTSPTRDYMVRKFNANKRKRESNFFKQAHLM